MTHLFRSAGRGHPASLLTSRTAWFRIQHPLETAALAWQAIANALRIWKNRQDFQRLSQMETHLLHDIGLTRADVEGALSKPAWCDPSEDLARKMNRKRQIAKLRRDSHSGHRSQMKWLG